MPVYDFMAHQRSAETRRVQAADVVILEGVFVCVLFLSGSRFTRISATQTHGLVAGSVSLQHARTSA